MRASTWLSTRTAGFSPHAHETPSAHGVLKTPDEFQRERALFDSNSTFNPSCAVESPRTGGLKPTLRVGWHPRWGWAAIAILLIHGEALADGGTVRSVEVCGDYQISVFTWPTPCRVGVVDVSVMVQDAKTGRVLPETRVAVIVAPSAHPSRAKRYQANAAAATNKLFHAALVEISTPGAWKIEVQVEGPHRTGNVQCEVEVAPALPKWEALWGWIAWPTVVIALFALRVCVQPERCAIDSARGSTS